jgi:uncharacterized protein (TIGR02996 family)
MNEQTFLQALCTDCTDELAWQALADWLEEDGQTQRAELLRLVRRLRALGLKRTKERGPLVERVIDMLSAGVRPVVPEVVNSVGMRLALIPPGRFLMGSQTGGSNEERPRHRVEITRPFYMGVHQVTQAQWQAIMGDNPSYYAATGEGRDEVVGLDTDDFPVDSVSWDDTQSFLRRLSVQPQEVQARHVYRLPSEAEWEYACRAGTSTLFHFGDSLSATQANFDGNHPFGDEGKKGPYLERPCPVGSYPPNAVGLYDMHGNVWEWCADWYGNDYYKNSPKKDPQGPAEGSKHMFRGGSWYYVGWYCRSATREATFGHRPNGQGFRVVMVPAE